MRSNKKIQHTQLFVEGMNTVTAPEFMSDKQYEYMLNCNVISTSVGNVGKVTNKKGNTKVSVELPEGLNTTIGCVNDEEKNNFYYAVWNSLGFHSWFRYNDVSNTIVRVVQNLTDTEGVSVFNWLEGELILHANIIANKLLYWVIKGDTGRKINIQKCLNGDYGAIQESYTRAYKKTALNVPVATYISDPTRDFNRLYGHQYKFAERFRYDDNEISHVSGFSNTALPDKEPYRGINVIPTDNNCIEVQMETGDKIVTDIELLMTNTDAEGFILGWVSVAVLNKKKLGISDNTIYTFKFYNDGSYPVVPQQEIDNPYSFLPVDPETQDFGKNSLIYGNFSEGFETIIPDATIELEYADLFVEPGTANEMNNPFFDWDTSATDYIGSKSTVTYYDGTTRTRYRGARFNKQTIYIGSDVKNGNEFLLYLADAGGHNYTIRYTAGYSDSQLTVYNEIVRQLIATGKIYRQTPDISTTSIYDYDIDGGGVLSFSYIMDGSNDYVRRVGQSVNPVSFNSLKDTGQSVATTKLGSTGKVGLVYEDTDGRKSLAFTDNTLVFAVKTINEVEKYQTVNFKISVKHIPPIEATTWYPVFSDDLTYGKFIQMLIQKVYEVPSVSGDDGEYLDLNIGSLLTYQKIHENTTLKFEFKPKGGDRIRLIKYMGFVGPTTETFYDFFETEIISYKDFVETKVNSVATVDGTNTVKVAETSEDNIGLNIRINGVERRIVGVTDSTHYTVDNPYPGDGTAGTDEVNYPTYEILNYNGVIRIKKPSTPEILDNSIIEIFSPSLNLRDELQGYWDVGYRFPVLNAGTKDRVHGGDINQTPSVDAVVNVNNNNVYVRNREMPLSNTTPNTQVYITPIEDPSFSDFYVSNFTDRGRKFVADIGAGKVYFGSRLRHSSNYIEDTRINGLNYFYSLEREDYNDTYGDIKRINVDGDLLYIYKQLRTGYVMMGKRILTQADGTQIISTTTKLLSDMNYFAMEDGGIGNNPEAFIKNDTVRYHLAPVIGAVVRLSRDGETAISEIYYLDNKIREYISRSQKNGSRVFFGIDKFTGNLIITFAGSEDLVFVNNGDFNKSDYQLLDALPPEDTTFTILTSPTHGTLDLTDPKFPIYTSDAGYVGPDNFTYSAVIDGDTVTRKVCIPVEALPVVLKWRVKESSVFCVTDGGYNTGYKGWSTLEQFDIIGGSVTGEEKPNAVSDPDYVAPVYDVSACPIPVPVVNLVFLLKNDYLDSYLTNTGLGTAKFSFTDTTEEVFLIPSQINRDGVEHSYEVENVIGKEIDQIAGYPYIVAMAGIGEWKNRLYYNGSIIKTTYFNGGNSTGSDVQIQTVFNLDTPITPVDGDTFKIEWTEQLGTIDIPFTILTTALKEWNGDIFQEVGTKTKPALSPFNTSVYNYMKKNLDTGDYTFSAYMYADGSDTLGPGSPVYYLISPPTEYYYEFPIKIGQIDNPSDYPTTPIPLTGSGRTGYTAIGSIETDGGIYFNSQSGNGFVAFYNDAQTSSPPMSECIFRFYKS